VTETEANRAVVAKLMTILSGDTPIEAGAELLSLEVVAHVDEWRFEGINVWANWIRYIRTRGRLAEPTLVVDRIEMNSDASVTARGRWEGTRDGRRLMSNPCVARYRIAEGRIVEIWSTRRNYVFLCGGHLEYRAGLALELLRARQWRKRAPQLDLTSHTRARQASFVERVQIAWDANDAKEKRIQPNGVTTLSRRGLRAL
jgi:hypothetical protein